MARTGAVYMKGDWTDVDPEITAFLATRPEKSVGLPERWEQATAALKAFRLSCPSLLRRPDASGLTQNAEWTESCNAAKGWADRDATNFFSRYFGTVQVGAGTAFVTGYYEPEIAASRTKSADYDIPIYRRPADLQHAGLADFRLDHANPRWRGRVRRLAMAVLP